MIDKYISDICDVLGIETPSVSFDTSHFSTNTMLAQCNSAGTTIYIKKAKRPTPDYMFAIAHELRHIWQIRTDKGKYSSGYQTAEKIGTEQYNKQLAEVDANAFASIIMHDFFKLRPLFHGLSDSTILMIEKRMKEIEC